MENKKNSKIIFPIVSLVLSLAPIAFSFMTISAPPWNVFLFILLLPSAGLAFAIVSIYLSESVIGRIISAVLSVVALIMIIVSLICLSTISIVNAMWA